MDRTPGERPPDSRRLERPPSARYGPDPAAPSATGGAEEGAPGGSLARAVAFALPAALISLFAYVAFAGPLAFSAGLVVVAIFAGRIIGLSARAGGGGAIPSDQSVTLALAITVGWFVLAQVGTWLFAQSEGGVLPIVDYLGQTFGPVVPLGLIASVLAAWWSAR